MYFSRYTPKAPKGRNMVRYFVSPFQGLFWIIFLDRALPYPIGVSPLRGWWFDILHSTWNLASKSYTAVSILAFWNVLLFISLPNIIHEYV